MVLVVVQFNKLRKGYAVRWVLRRPFRGRDQVL